MSHPEEEEEGSEGTLPPSDELEAALREATESVEARAAGKAAEAGASADSGSPDKIIIEALSDELQLLKKEFDEVKSERDDLKDRMLRLQAEFDNFRRRGLKERQEAHNFGHQNLVKDLLPSVDNLERAIAAAEGSGAADLQGLLQGIELVRRELLGVLGNHGVNRIEAAGEPFDPAIHEAMAQVEDDGVPANSVVQVLEEGYQLRDRMLRPARVMVSRSSQSSDTEAGSADAVEAGPQEEEQ
jgi:molecular chaperone GrpE